MSVAIVVLLASGNKRVFLFLELKFSKQARSVVTRYAEFSQRPD